ERRAFVTLADDGERERRRGLAGARDGADQVVVALDRHQPADGHDRGVVGLLATGDEPRVDAGRDDLDAVSSEAQLFDDVALRRLRQRDDARPPAERWRDATFDD